MIMPTPVELKMKGRVRIGMVNFINTAPLYHVWKSTVQRPDWEIIEETPAVLNSMLAEGKLDLGLVSSHEYALHPGDYRILSDLSISSSGAVGSVFLFSQTGVENLSGKLVRLSRQSQTSNSLVKIILEDFMGEKPEYSFHSSEGHKNASAVLAIGDEALRLSTEGRYPFALDLGEIWHEKTGLPFVFAVWAVREDFFSRSPDNVREIHQELRRCLGEGRKQLREISHQVASLVPMEPEECHAYLRGIEYDLDSDKVKGLEEFYKRLINRGEGSRDALPLKICG